jgi:hypothetical protein
MGDVDTKRVAMEAATEVMLSLTAVMDVQSRMSLAEQRAVAAAVIEGGCLALLRVTHMICDDDDIDVPQTLAAAIYRMARANADNLAAERLELQHLIRGVRDCAAGSVNCDPKRDGDADDDEQPR